jgi:hypothetical protein
VQRDVELAVRAEARAASSRVGQQQYSVAHSVATTNPHLNQMVGQLRPQQPMVPQQQQQQQPPPVQPQQQQQMASSMAQSHMGGLPPMEQRARWQQQQQQQQQNVDKNTC